ncbi:hypothetical protein [Flavobacterium sp. YJ01]|uniref:hypothetical protein n=1 Tax=unclassified Flavobacterium TaxID=196869 RepID=UPI0023E355DD|nr:hypothetical protein [Flavobacterium sp. YJ01]WET02412.1 hypothetical protein P0R33_21905 [Flavobacterium sp. YJ01]
MITDSSNYDNSNASDNAYLDNEFSNALERDGQQTPEKDDLDENLQDHQALDADDLDNDLSERNDEDGSEPETFSDDGYKID